jgi:hypothetical protein
MLGVIVSSETKWQFLKYHTWGQKNKKKKKKKKTQTAL